MAESIRDLLAISHDSSIGCIDIASGAARARDTWSAGG